MQKKTKTARPRTRVSSSSREERWHALQELDNMCQEIFGSALELRNDDELPNSVDRRSSDEQIMNVREMNDQSLPISAIQTSKAVSGISNALSDLVLLTEKVCRSLSLAGNEVLQALANE